MTIKDYLLNEGRAEGKIEGRAKEKLIQQLKILNKCMERDMNEDEIMYFLDIDKQELNHLKKQL